MHVIILPYERRSLADITQVGKESLQRASLSTEGAPHSLRAFQSFVQGLKFGTIANDDDIFTIYFSHIYAKLRDEAQSHTTPISAKVLKIPYAANELTHFHPQIKAFYIKYKDWTSFFSKSQKKSIILCGF